MPEVVVASDSDAVANLGAQFIVKLITRSDKAGFHFALSGGATPQLMYSRLIEKPFVDQIPWADLHIWWSDERAVGPESKYSNYRAAENSFLDLAPVPAENVHRIEGELGACQAAARYEHEIEAAIGKDGCFDLILLGLGTDGHTASIFPESISDLPVDRRVAVTDGGDPELERVTFTFSAINAARDVMMIAEREEKAAMVARMLMGDKTLPVGFVEPDGGSNHLHIFLDRDAAKDLEEG